MTEPLPTDALALLLKAVAELQSRSPNTANAAEPSESLAGMPEDKRLELIRVLCWGAMEQARASADLLARALGVAGRDALALDEQSLEQVALGDGFLERAARQGLKLVDIERAYVHAVLRVVGGNKSEAARRLGINRRTLQRRLGDGDELDDDVDADDVDADADADDARVAQS